MKLILTRPQHSAGIEYTYNEHIQSIRSCKSGSSAHFGGLDSVVTFVIDRIFKNFLQLIQTKYKT